MFKNTASQKVALFAFDTTTGTPKTGDSANITPYVSKDYGTVTVLGTTTATEMDATNAKGWYSFTLAQAETNGDMLLFTAKSSTANISLVGLLIATQPANWTAASFDGSGRVDIGKLLGTAWLTPGVAGTPDVNVKLWNALTTIALPLVPTVAGRTLDCSAGGEAGLDWANIGSPTTANNLSGTTTNLVNTVTTYTGNTPQTGDAYARIGAAGAGLTALGDTRIANLDAAISSRLATSGYTAPPTAAQNATAVFTTQLTESYAALHAVPTLAQILFENRSLLAGKSVATTVLTAYKVDGVSVAGTYTLSDATSPVSITRAS